MNSPASRFPACARQTTLHLVRRQEEEVGFQVPFGDGFVLLGPLLAQQRMGHHSQQQSSGACFHVPPNCARA